VDENLKIAAVRKNLAGEAKITLTTSGYNDEADVYYAEVTVASGKQGTDPPDEYSAYHSTPWPSIRAGISFTDTITGLDENTDVYLVVFKDGKVSEPYKIPVVMEQDWFAYVVAPTKMEIRLKFDYIDQEADQVGVTDTFKKLHEFIQMGGLTERPDVINLGDYINLDSLSVDNYNEAGEIVDATNTEGVDNHTSTKYYRLRLIVVGINSFRSGPGDYTVTGNDEDHVVFQFQGAPISRRMNPTDTNAGGYAASEMRKYLLNDEDSDGTTLRTSFLAGLVNAGVPKEVMWAPKRYVSTKGAVAPLDDLLWLPTEREMFGSNDHSESSEETGNNQARLKYYSWGSSTAKKYIFGTEKKVNGYWLGSPVRDEGKADDRKIHFVYVTMEGTPVDHQASTNAAAGCAPAFCIK
jgi:hypothetical protein